MHTASHPFPALTSILVAALAALTPLHAADPVWVPITPGAAEATEAEVVALPAGSDEQRTQVQVTIHGFWQEDVLGDDGNTYQRITVPGLPSMGIPGAPELPVARFVLAVPTDAFEARLIGFDELAVHSYPGVIVAPQPQRGSDEEYDPTEDPGPGDTQGFDDVWTKDAALYALQSAWPATADDGPFAVSPVFGAFDGAACQSHPMSWNPDTKDLRVVSQMLFTYSHSGLVAVTPDITKKKMKIGSKVFVNWPYVSGGFLPNLFSYHSRYLIVTSSAYAGALDPFVLHKRILGYDTEVVTPTLTSASIQNAIDTWYAAGSPEEDHYCLLVGDTNVIPLVSVSGAGASDDPYGSVNGDFFKEVFVGRLSVDNVADLMVQTQKIIDYEINPVSGGSYDEVVMVAHDQDAPFKYTQAHVSVIGGSYATPPTFLLHLGFTGATDAGVRAAINADVGLVCYRGHGSTNAWTDWNPSAEDFHKNDILALNNANGIQPVVWSIACTNSNIAFDSPGLDDCFGETWLEATNGGGVAHYGATASTHTSFNHVLDRRLFRTVYDDGVTAHGQATDVSEFIMWIAGWSGKNNWLYHLLGDPSMNIRRERAEEYTVTYNFPAAANEEPGDTVDVAINVFDSSGQPAEGVQVSLYKASMISSNGDEVFTNVYADSSGVANFVIAPDTPGSLYWSVQSEFGDAVVGQVAVTMSEAWSDLGGGVSGAHGRPTLAGIGSLQGGKPMSLVLRDAAPNAAATLVVGFNAVNAPFKAGVLVPDTDLLIPGLLTNVDGEIVIPAEWPHGAPAGFSFFTQFWIVDGAAPVGLAGSNGLQGTTP